MHEQSLIGWVSYRIQDYPLESKSLAGLRGTTLIPEPAYRISLIRKPRIVHGSFLSREDFVPDSCFADNLQCRPG